MIWSLLQCPSDVLDTSRCKSPGPARNSPITIRGALALGFLGPLSAAIGPQFYDPGWLRKTKSNLQSLHKSCWLTRGENCVWLSPLYFPLLLFKWTARWEDHRTLFQRLPGVHCHLSFVPRNISSQETEAWSLPKGMQSFHMPALETKPMHFKCHQVCSSADDSTVITREGSSYLTHSLPPNVEGLWETERFLFFLIIHHSPFIIQLLMFVLKM